MALTLKDAREQLDGRTMTLAEDGTRTGQRVYHVTWDISAATLLERQTLDAASEAALPVAQYAPHPAYPAAIARTVTTSPLAKDAYKCVIGYSSAPFKALGDGTGGAASGTGGGPASPAGSGNSSTAAEARPPEIRIATRCVRSMTPRLKIHHLQPLAPSE